MTTSEERRGATTGSGASPRSTGLQRVPALAVLAVFAVLAAACSSGSGTSSSATTVPGPTTGTRAPLSLPADVTDAPSDTVWLCTPGKPDDPCSVPLTTTAVATDGTTHVEHLRPAKDPPIDCFYVYPTVSPQKGPNANLHIDPAEIAVAQQQAAQFSRVCRVFAPMYPQLTLGALRTAAGRSAAVTTKAYRGVLDAWNDYLAHHNHGRGVVLIGHSQGAAMLTRLIRSEVDRSPAERRLLVSAILLGGNVIVPAGADVGGDFTHVPACRAVTQTGCVIAYSTFDHTPPSGSLFGRPVPILAGPVAKVAHPQVLCTNPAALGGGSGPLVSLFRVGTDGGGATGQGPLAALGGLTAKMFAGRAPSAATPWVAWDGWYQASCSDAGGAHVLLVEPVGPAPELTPEPGTAWGLHLLDVNLSLGNLVTIVRHQAAAYHH